MTNQTKVSPLEAHLAEKHGIVFDWDTYGPCDSSPVGLHNALHASDAPNHYHERGSSMFEVSNWKDKD